MPCHRQPVLLNPWSAQVFSTEPSSQRIPRATGQASHRPEEERPREVRNEKNAKEASSLKMVGGAPSFPLSFFLFSLTLYILLDTNWSEYINADLPSKNGRNTAVLQGKSLENATSS